MPAKLIILGIFSVNLYGEFSDSCHWLLFLLILKSVVCYPVWFLVSVISDGECPDIHGRSISPGLHYVPGPDTCTLCICENGQPKWCKAVLCSPPQVWLFHLPMFLFLKLLGFKINYIILLFVLAFSTTIWVPFKKTLSSFFFGVSVWSLWWCSWFISFSVAVIAMFKPLYYKSNHENNMFKTVEIIIIITVNTYLPCNLGFKNIVHSVQSDK